MKKEFQFIKGLIFLMILTISHSCKKDSETPRIVESFSEEKSAIIETISFTDFRKNVKLQSVGNLQELLLQPLNANKQLTFKQASYTEELIINTDSVKKVIANGHLIYVFSIKQTIPGSVTFRNLTIDESVEGTKAFITTYTPTNEWITSWKLKRSRKFEGEVRFRPIDLGITKISKKKSTTGSPSTSATMCTTYNIYVTVDYPCSTGDLLGNCSWEEPGSHIPPGSWKPYQITTSYPLSECFETGGSGGTGDGGGGTTPNPGGDYFPQPAEPSEAVIDGLVVTSDNYPGREYGWVWLWWEFDHYVSTLDLTADGANYGLNAAEVALAKRYPFEAQSLFRNKIAAEHETLNRFGENGLNNKSDAFRHAFFNALNYRDCRINVNGISIAKLFSDAHETTTPLQLQLEKQMDLFNNAVGHQVGSTANMYTLNYTLSGAVNNKLLSGDLMYLKPTLSPQQDPSFFGANWTNDPQTATHGIIPTTVLTPTNR